jgi:hypothetical protein
MKIVAAVLIVVGVGLSLYGLLNFHAVGSSEFGWSLGYNLLTAIFSGLNLNNEVFGFYQGSPQYFIQREYYKPTYTFGLRWDLHRE